MRNKIGIIQGRLTQFPSQILQQFPQKNWKKEFSIAKDLKLNFIELISEKKFNPSNPIWSDEGRKKIKKINQKNKLINYSLCDDFFLSNHILKKNSKIIDQHIKKILNATSDLKLKVLVLPLLEKNDLRKFSKNYYLNFLTDLAIEFKKSKIIICIETLENHYKIDKLLCKINLENIKYTFDTGNMNFEKLKFPQDILILKDFIHHIHIKDKNNKNNNVMISKGKTEFKKILKSLKKIDYKGSFVFETPRGSDPIKSAINNINVFKNYMNQVN